MSWWTDLTDIKVLSSIILSCVVFTLPPSGRVTNGQQNITESSDVKNLYLSITGRRVGVQVIVAGSNSELSKFSLIIHRVEATGNLVRLTAGANEEEDLFTLRPFRL